jgi:hypothetical protein
VHREGQRSAHSGRLDNYGEQQIESSCDDFQLGTLPCLGDIYTPAILYSGLMHFVTATVVNFERLHFLGAAN